MKKLQTDELPVAVAPNETSMEGIMAWREYQRLIEQQSVNPADWRSAATGNPDTPIGALAQAVRESKPQDVAALLLAMMERIAAFESGAIPF